MNCKEIHKDLIGIADGSLNVEDNQHFNSHLESCSSCKAKIDFLNASLSIIEDEKSHEADPYFMTRLEQRIKNRQEQDFNSISLLRKIKPSFIYLGIVIAIIGGVWLGNYSVDSVDEMSTNQNEYFASEILPSYADNLYAID